MEARKRDEWQKSNGKSKNSDKQPAANFIEIHIIWFIYTYTFVENS